MAAIVPLFTPAQVEKLTLAFHAGAASASEAMTKWLSRPTVITIDSVDQCSLEQAPTILGDTGDEVCMCLMQMGGDLSGPMILAFDDVSGLVLADIVLGRQKGTSSGWDEFEKSAVLESMNIVGCAYLNGMARCLSKDDESVTLVPAPPIFLRDFAESLLQMAFMEQATEGRSVIFARARFEMQGAPIKWTFLLIPDPPSIARLSQLLQGDLSSSGRPQ
ncbi:MAG TPA: hypothetical protein VEI07_01875 [Planctomycetaceae bacterium]|nr:hypothetical protein [Planctomycetaceae bacterium]